MPNLYTLLVSGAAVVPVLLLIAIVRRSSSRAPRSIDLHNFTVSRQWLMDHQSHER